MKQLLPKLLLLFSVMMTQWGHAQWYSYDAFEAKKLNMSQLLSLSVAKSDAALQKQFATQRVANLKTIVSANVNRLKAELKVYDSVFIQRMLDTTQRIQTLQKGITTATGATNDSLKAQLEIAQANCKYLSDGREKDSLKALRQEFRYMLIRSRPFNFFPVWNAKAAQAYFENSDTVINSDDEGIFSFESSYLNYLPSAKTLAAYTEPIGDFLGPVRLSLGLLVTAPAAKEDTVTTEKFDKKRFNEKFKSGGGNVSINAGFPLVHAHASKYFDFKSYYSPRFALDVPKSGEGINHFPLHAQWLAVDNQVKIMTLENKLSFLLCHRYARISGNSTFYDSMGFTGKERKSFNFTTWTVGFIAKNRLAVYYTWYAGSSKVVNGISNNGSITANIQLD